MATASQRSPGAQRGHTLTRFRAAAPCGREGEGRTGKDREGEGRREKKREGEKRRGKEREGEKEAPVAAEASRPCRPAAASSGRCPLQAARTPGLVYARPETPVGPTRPEGSPRSLCVLCGSEHKPLACAGESQLWSPRSHALTAARLASAG